MFNDLTQGGLSNERRINGERVSLPERHLNDARLSACLLAPAPLRDNKIRIFHNYNLCRICVKSIHSRLWRSKMYRLPTRQCHKVSLTNFAVLKTNAIIVFIPITSLGAKCDPTLCCVIGRASRTGDASQFVKAGFATFPILVFIEVTFMFWLRIPTQTKADENVASLRIDYACLGWLAEMRAIRSFSESLSFFNSLTFKSSGKTRRPSDSICLLILSCADFSLSRN